MAVDARECHIPRGVRPRLEGKPRTPLSSRVATRVSWSPLLWQMSTREAPFSGERQHVLYAVVAYHLRPALQAPVFTDSVPRTSRDGSQLELDREASERDHVSRGASVDSVDLRVQPMWTPPIWGTGLRSPGHPELSRVQPGLREHTS